jgi:ATP-dependent helicase/nuclease subunit B
MDPFLAQLADLCGDQRTRAKWVVVPTHALGHTLGERLVLGGTAWANLRFATPLELALQMAAPFLVERGIAPAADEVGPALVMRLLLDLPPSVPAYFRRLAEQPKMAEALWATIHELRMAGVSAADLAPAAFVSADKHAELSALLAAYEAHLAARRLADSADVYHEALGHLDVGPVLPGDLRIELPGVVWAPLERRLLDALLGTRLTPRSLALPGLPPLRRLASQTAPQAPAPRSDAARLAYVLRPGEAPPPLGDGSLAMFRAGGREAEVEEVLRRVLREGLRLDHVEVACAQAEHVVLLWEKAQRHGLPVTVGPGLPVTLTRPARALLAFCDWIEGGFAAGALRRLLQSGDVRLDLEDGPSAGQAARLLARSDATWGRQTYAAALARLAATSRTRAADEDTDDEGRQRLRERAAQAERLARWLDRLLGSVPEARDDVISLGPVLDACIGFVRDVATRASELDGAAGVVLVEALESLRALGDLERSPRAALGLVRHQVETLTVGGDRARPGHLFVTTLRGAGYSGRPHSFIVGLEEGRVFPALLEDAVLLDAERVALSPALATSQDLASEALHAVVTRLAALGGRVCLSFSCRDLRGHRETFPSWLMLQALRLLKPGREWTYRELNDELGEPVSAVPAAPAQAPADAGWWLAHVNGAGPSALPAVHDAFPWLAQGEVAEAARESDALTIYDGFVREAGSRLDPRQSGRAVSATTLEGLAQCPFRYFLERGLGLEAIEDAEPDRDRWLDPMTRGSLLHDLYAAILREVRQGGERVDPRRHGTRLCELAEARLAEQRELVPPPSEHVFQRERAEILDDLALFLRLEVEEPGREPVGFEVSFGGGPSEGEPLAQADPVTVELAPGLAFRLRGRIDRIDRLSEGGHEVVDYKTGWYRPDQFAGTFIGGRLLQHALYAVAAAQLLRRRDAAAHVTCSSYYLPTVRGQAQRVVCPPVTRDQLAAVLRDLFDVLAAGAFVHAEKESDCRYCDFGAACGRQAFAHGGRKLANTANVVLEPLRRLATYE